MFMMPFINVSENIITDMMNDVMMPFRAARNTVFRTDVRENEDGFEITADLPGVKREDINAEVNGDILTLTADFGSEEKNSEGYTHIERRSGKFSRSFNIRGIDKEAIRAKFENGVLTMTLPKAKKAIPEAHGIVIEGTSEKKEEGAA